MSTGVLRLASYRLTPPPPPNTVTGTPGIGKSYFLYYLLAELLALENPPPFILWEHVLKTDTMVNALHVCCSCVKNNHVTTEAPCQQV